MSVKVWHHGTNAQGVEVPSGLGTFETEGAYVVVVDSPGSVFVWSGTNSSEDTKGSATAQATELIGQFTENTNISIQFEKQGEESADFSKLFPSLEYVTSAAAVEGGDEGGDSDGPAEDVAGGDQAGGKKKKKKKKGKGAAGAGATSDVAGESEDGEPAAVAESTPALQEEPAEEEHKPLSEIAGAPTPTSEQAALMEELENALPDPVESAPEEPKVEEGEPVGEDATPGKPIIKAASTTDLNANLSPVVSSKSYVADSAKAWGGAATPVQVVGVKVQPGEKFYPYDELKELRLDSGIDVTKKEAYLADEDFEKVFKKDRAAFLAQPAWRQQLQKKEVGLF